MNNETIKKRKAEAFAKKHNGILPEYKTVKVVEPHCPICKHQLMGTNSDISPWECPCGIWKSDWRTDDAEMFGAGVCYNIIKK